VHDLEGSHAHRIRLHLHDTRHSAPACGTRLPQGCHCNSGVNSQNRQGIQSPR
jgi:hypothetical protein